VPGTVARDAVRCVLAISILGVLACGILAPRRPTRAPAATFAPPEGALTFDAASRAVAYDVGDDTDAAAVCVDGAATGGAEKLFTYNAHGRGTALASFQTDAGGSNINTYRLYKHVALTQGAATDASCGTGTLVTTKVVAT
jgi:hypothetical protein